MSCSFPTLRRALRFFFFGPLFFAAFFSAFSIPAAAAGEVPNIGDELTPQLPEGADPAISLACVTGALKKGGSIQITNQRNVAIDDPSEVFQQTSAPASGNVHLRCKDSWAATGCSAAAETSHRSSESPSGYSGEQLKTTSNGCELIGSASAPTLYLNCCKVASNLEPDTKIGVKLVPTTAPLTSLPAVASGRLGLACVTAKVSGYDEENIAITSQQNITVVDWRDAFTFDRYDGGEDPWGLVCNDDWIFSGCSGSQTLMPLIPARHPDAPVGRYHSSDIVSGFNGCRTDNEEIWAGATLYATCCKLRLVGAAGED